MYSQMGTLVNRLQAWMLIKACTHTHTHTHTPNDLSVGSFTWSIYID